LCKSRAKTTVADLGHTKRAEFQEKEVEEDPKIQKFTKSTKAKDNQKSKELPSIEPFPLTT